MKLTETGRRDLSGLAVDTAALIAFIAFLGYLVISILLPFATILLWAIILAVALHPAFSWLEARLGGRGGLAATILSLGLLAIVVGPVVLLSGSMIGSLKSIAASMSEETFAIPPPSETVRSWPLVGEWLYQAWASTAEHLGDTLVRFAPQLRTLGTTVLGFAAGLGGGVLQFVVSIMFAGLMLRATGALSAAARTIARRLTTRRGDILVDMVAATIRNVSRGVIGVAILQAILAAIGLVAADVPAAGLIAFAALVLAIVQIGPGILLTLVIIWVWSAETTTTAILFTAYMVPVMLFDNFLRPMMMARGLNTPMIVIVIGVIGGTLSFGLLGVFIGPIVLAVFYDLVTNWVLSADTAGGPDEGTPDEAGASRPAPMD
ncbi:MAG: AI-2E family transporter [Alphaproteobacteria bacterium]